MALPPTFLQSFTGSPREYSSPCDVTQDREGQVLLPGRSEVGATSGLEGGQSLLAGLEQSPADWKWVFRGRSVQAGKGRRE